MFVILGVGEITGGYLGGYFNALYTQKEAGGFAIGSYLLCIVIGINPWLSILGGIAYGYCSYNPIIIAVGHDTKFLSMAYAPAILASMILIFKKKYWVGGALLLIFSTCFYSSFSSVSFLFECLSSMNYEWTDYRIE